MKKTLLISLVLLTTFPCAAKHIVGGEMLYTYIGPGAAPDSSKYLITLKLFRNQAVAPDVAKMPDNVFIGIFNNDNGTQYPGPFPWYDVPKNNETPVTVNPFPPCISNPHVGLSCGNISSYR